MPHMLAAARRGGAVDQWCDGAYAAASQADRLAALAFSYALPRAAAALHCCRSPLPPAAAATTHRSSDGPCPSDSCTPPSSATGTATAVAITAAGGSAGAPQQQLLHPQAVQRGMPQQAQQGMAWPVQVMPGGLPGMPQMHPQLGMVQLVPVAAGMLPGMMPHMAKQPALPHNHHGQNGKPKASSQRQATNREAQKRYRCGGRPLRRGTRHPASFVEPRASAACRQWQGKVHCKAASAGHAADMLHAEPLRHLVSAELQGAAEGPAA